jgi:heme-degrading monooxygenase HmoA
MGGQVYARLSRFAGLDPERVFETVQDFRDNGIPQLQQQRGFRGVTVGVNHRSGQAMAITLWDNEADMTASEKLAGHVRGRALERAQPSREPVIDHYEIVVHE